MSYSAHSLTRRKEDGVVYGDQNYIMEIWGFTCDSPARSLITGNRGHTARNACPKCKTNGVYYTKILRSPARCVEEKHFRISTLFYGPTKTLSTGRLRISTPCRQLYCRNWTSTGCWISRWTICTSAVLE